MEPRTLLAADATGSRPPADSAALDIEMHLPGSIAGSVFAASPAGDLHKAVDSGIEGVRIALLDSRGNAVAEAVTDERGGYEFPALPPGMYSLLEAQPQGFDDGAAILGSGGGVRLTNSAVSKIVVSPGDVLVAYDFWEIAASPTPAQAPAKLPAPIGFIPKLSVSWSQPVEWVLVEPLAFEAAIPASRPQPPLLLRALEPVFGGSSGAPLDEDRAAEAFSDEAKVDDRMAASSGDAMPEAERPTAIARAYQAARDRAFELQAGSDEDEAAAVDRATGEPSGAAGPTESRRIAKRPAA